MEPERPTTFWEARVAKAQREGTWDKPPPSGLPKGAMTSTARQSRRLAWGWTVLGIGRLGLSGWDAATGESLDWGNLVLGVATVVFGGLYFRSYRILERTP